MDIYKDNEILHGQLGLVNYTLEVMRMAQEEKELLNNVYREISEVSGTDTAIEIYRLFRGQQISFPIRLLIRSVFVGKF